PDNGVRQGTAYGRDHNPNAMTIWLAGGGCNACHTIGATDELGMSAVEEVHHGLPVNIHASYNLLKRIIKNLTMSVSGPYDPDVHYLKECRMSEFEKMDPHVLGRRIADFRKACGKTQEETGKHLNMSRPTYIGIEKGTRRVTSDEIVSLASYFGRSVHEMVRPEVSNIELEPHLRAALDHSTAESNDVLAAIRQLHEFAVDYRELERIVGAKPFENYPPEVQIPGSRLAEFAEDVAARERSRLHIGDGPVLELRQVLENNVGVRIFCVPIESSVAGMYAFVPDLGYCILLNAAHPHAKQRWTLAHEYGHFLADRHKPGVDYTRHADRSPAGERFADAFAMCFLMPATGLRRQYFDVTNSRGDFQVADLCSLANYYAVSVQAMTLRLEALSLIRKGTWDLLSEQGFKPDNARKSLELRPRETRSREPYPARYKFLAVLAYREDKLSEGELAKFLRTDRVSARKIVRDCESRSDDVGSDGMDAVLNFPLEHSLLSAS
ncbi:MAG TPA: ImmA/IrrE family metallo-endopeptidase, partial [Planctomycetaceae bacterium]|nr:ImmA/IrrE family metallo-endopeptidase [Planctomycetaceae bacterium]